MKPHVVISRFRAAGGYVDPPGMWTPGDQPTADRLIEARCLRPMTDKEAKRLDDAQAEAERAAEKAVQKMQATKPKAEPPKGKSKGKGWGKK